MFQIRKNCCCVSRYSEIICSYYSIYYNALQMSGYHSKVNEKKWQKKRNKIKSRTEARQKQQFQYIIFFSVLFSSFIAIHFKREEIFVFIGIFCYYNIRYVLMHRSLTDKNIMLYQETNILYCLLFQDTRSCLQHFFVNKSIFK